MAQKRERVTVKLREPPEKQAEKKQEEKADAKG
jgi:hypothetical protein